MADRAQARASDLAGALGDIIGHRKNLLALLVKQQVVIPEMRAGHVPVKVLGLEVERESVGEQGSQGRRDIPGRVFADIRRRFQGG